MSDPDPRHAVATVETLEALLGAVNAASRQKEISYIHDVYRPLIAASPFAILATSGPRGLDASPRGDAPGFVQVLNERTLLLPERPGNNRADSLRNILSDPRVALLFLIPALGETLRVNGMASIATDPVLMSRLAVQGKEPVCVIRISVESVFFQCARAIKRSDLWGATASGARPPVPSAGQILGALSDPGFGAEEYDRSLDARQRASLY